MSNNLKYSYFDLLKEVESGKFRHVYMISAFDSFLSDLFINKIIDKKFKNFSENIFYRYGDEVSFEEISDFCCNYSSLFAQEKLVVVKRSEKLTKELENIKNYIAKPAHETILIMLFDKSYVEEKKLYKDFDISDFSALIPDEVLFILKHEFENRGMKVDKDTIELFISLFPENLSLAVNEINKIDNYLFDNQNKIVNREIILKISGYEPEYTPAELIKAIYSKDCCKALSICDYLTNKSSFSEIYLLYLIFSFYSDLLCFKSKSFNRFNSNSAYKKYKIWGERWNIASSYSSAIKIKEIEFAVKRITETDKNLKTTMLDSKVLLTSLVEELTNFSTIRN